MNYKEYLINYFSTSLGIFGLILMIIIVYYIMIESIKYCRLAYNEI